MQILNCMMHYSQIFPILTFKLLLLEDQIGLVKQFMPYAVSIAVMLRAQGILENNKIFIF